MDNSRKNTPDVFKYYADGFSFEKEKILWNEIELIQAYKLDLFTTDEVCVDIFQAGKKIRISESTEGFERFIEVLNKQFPSIANDWFWKIVQPPFQTNFTVLFKKG